MISLHDNVAIARNVDFVTHDVIHCVLNRLPKDMKGDHRFRERIGCIEIMDNVMIGSNSVILYGTRIGPNVIVGSGSVVTKDLEPNGVYVGVPARRIGSFDDFLRKRIKQEESELFSCTTHNQALTKKEIEAAWRAFHLFHEHKSIPKLVTDRIVAGESDNLEEDG